MREIDFKEQPPSNLSKSGWERARLESAAGISSCAQAQQDDARVFKSRTLPLASGDVRKTVNFAENEEQSLFLAFAPG
jgi:hypothetical protein